MSAGPRQPAPGARPPPARAAGVGPFLDLSSNPHLPILTDLVLSLARPDASGGAPGRGMLEPLVEALRRLPRCETYIWLSTRGLPPGQFRIARWLTPTPGVAPASAPVADPWGDVSALPVHSAGFLSRVVASPEPKLARGLHLDDDPLLGNQLAGMRSMVAAPHLDGSGAAAWTLVFHPDEHGLTEDDLEETILKTALVGTMANNLAATRELRRATAWIQSEIDQIADIQRSLLPQEEPDIPGLSFAAHYATFDRAGGDYYDLLPLRHTPGEPNLPRYTEDLASPWAIILADASGHGPSAAVVTAMLHSIVHTGLTAADGVIGASLPPPGTVERRRRAQPSPAALLEAVGRRLFARRVGPGGGLSFVTAFLGIYDPVARTLTYANAGHHPPLLRTRGSRGVALLRPADAPAGTPLGIRETVGAADSVLHLEDGHTLVLYTDGVVEAPGPRDRALWGADRLAAAVASGPEDPRTLTAHLVRALRAHEAGQRPRDDQTILVLQAV